MKNPFLSVIYLFFLTVSSLCASEQLSDGEISTLCYVDHDRERPIIADIYSPVNTSKAKLSGGYPLIILSHGYGGSRTHLSWFAKALSRKGYVVAALEHFGNTASFDTPKIALQRWLRPQDVTFFLNNFLKDEQWHALINKDKIGFAGFSLGGLTGVWLAGGIADAFTKPIVGISSMYELAINVKQSDVDSIDYAKAHEDYKDDRIKAAFLMAPAHGFSFTEKGLKKMRVPVSIVVGRNDVIAPMDKNATHYANHIPGAELHVLEGNVSHLAFCNKVEADKIKCASSFEFEVNPDVDVDDVHRQTEAFATAFFAKTLK